MYAHSADTTGAKGAEMTIARITKESVRRFPTQSGRSWFGRCSECGEWLRGIKVLRGHIQRTHI